MEDAWSCPCVLESGKNYWGLLSSSTDEELDILRGDCNMVSTCSGSSCAIILTDILDVRSFVFLSRCWTNDYGIRTVG